MQNQTYIPDRLLNNALSSETLQNALLNEGYMLPHLAKQSDIYITDTNKTI